MSKPAQYDFSGKHAVITGGAAGIGEACAARLIGGGATVTLWDRDAQSLKEAQARLGASAHGVQVDVSDEHSVAQAVKATLAFGASIYILVNSAGITGPNVTVIDYPVDEWNRVFDINVRGTFLTCRAIAA